eukprot:GEMP01000862.1.p1 GENE.GEMP01000862.1~~GEMP01000862.1.p1  ORF type:complete len:920 (+),score=101.74 GEMP01000862.1:137-2896(+)
MGSLPSIPWSANDGLSFTISVDAIACVLLIVLFLIVRNLRGDNRRTPETADIFGRLRRTSDQFISASVSFRYVASRVIQHRQEDTAIYGVGGQNYLHMLWHLGCLFGVLSIVSMFFIFPMELGLVDVTSNDPFKNFRERLKNDTLISTVKISVSANKLQEGSMNMWIVCAVAWFYSLSALWVVNRLVFTMQKPAKTTPDSGLTSVSQMFTVMVHRIPPTVDKDFNAKALKDLIFREFGEIIAVHIVPEMEVLSTLYDELDRVTDRLNYLYELDARQFEGQFINGEWVASSKASQLPTSLAWHVPPRRWRWPPKEGGLEFLVDAYQQEKKRLEDAIGEVDQEEIKSTGCAFITFTNVGSLLKVTKANGTGHVRYQDGWRGTVLDELLTLCRYSPFKPKHLKIIPAPHSEDINWENLSVSGVSRIFRSIFAIGLLSLVMIIIVTPVSLSNVILPIVLNVQSDIKLLMEKQTEHLPAGVISQLLRKINGSYNHLFTAFFTQYFPMVGLIFLNSVVLPCGIEYVASFQAYWRKEFKEQSTLMMNYSFMVLNLLIIPLLGLDSINALMLYIFERVRMGLGKPLFLQLQELAEMLGIVLLSSSATFAMKYFVTSIFISSASQLLQAPQTFLVWFNSSRSVTSKEKEEANARWPFDWGYWYGYNCAFFAVAITFAPSVPTICPLAALHFFIKYYVDRYTLVYGVFEPMFQAEGHVEQLVTRCLYSAIAFMQVVMSGFFAIQAVNDPNFVYASWLHIVLIFVIIFLAVTRTDIKRDLSDFHELDYKALYDQYRTPSLDIEELHFREQLPTVYRHPAIRGNPRLKAWANWQWPATGQAYPVDRLISIQEEDEETGYDVQLARRAENLKRMFSSGMSPMSSNSNTPSPGDAGANKVRPGFHLSMRRGEMEPLLEEDCCTEVTVEEASSS